MVRNTLVAVGIAGILIFSAGALAKPVSALSVTELQVQIQQLLAKLADLNAQLNVAQGSSSGPGSVSSTISVSPASHYRICNILARNLGQGARGDDVMSLQEFLKGEGYLAVGATGYFGPATAQAVAKWQNSEGVSAIGNFGPLSRERIKIRCGGGVGNTSGKFSTNPSTGMQPLTVDFTYQPGEESGQYYIDFGDGQGQVMDIHQIYCIRAPCISPSRAVHTYTTAGLYNASVSRYIACLYTNPRCMMAQPAPLAYATVTVRGGTSNNLPPSISSFSGPTTLAVNASGTWTISASDPENGQLSYQVSWGDENVYAPNMSAAFGGREFVQTTTFTHTYAYAGTYTVTIVVRDSAGQEAKSSSTVQVGRGLVACTMQYDPVCGRPQGCMNTCPPGMYCTMMCQMYPAQTYGNRCALDAEGAQFLYNGQCDGRIAY